ncbi:MAG TPA: HNH endonuclease, partial [Longimicrobiales bacterium]
VVWTVLVGPIPPGMEINHKDGDKIHNDPANLELATPKQNVQHSIRTGLTPPRGFSPERRRALRQRAIPLRERGLSYREIGEALGVSQTSAFRLTR